MYWNAHVVKLINSDTKDNYNTVINNNGIVIYNPSQLYNMCILLIFKNDYK